MKKKQDKLIFNPTKISLCPNCYCATHTLNNGRCGKCKRLKKQDNSQGEQMGKFENGTGNKPNFEIKTSIEKPSSKPSEDLCSKCYNKKYPKADLFADIKSYTSKQVKKDIAGVWD